LLQKFEAEEDEGDGGKGYPMMMKGARGGGKGGPSGGGPGARRAKSSQELIGRRSKLPYLKGGPGYSNEDDDDVDDDAASSRMGARNGNGRVQQRGAVGGGKVLEVVDDGSGSLAIPKPRKPSNNNRRDSKTRNEVETAPPVKERAPPMKSVQERLREERDQKKAALQVIEKRKIMFFY